MPLFRRREIWFPTWAGWFVILVLVASPAGLWWVYGEAFLSKTERVPADVLVLEAWIGPEGIDAAAQEFKAHPYRYLVITGGKTGSTWSTRRWSYVEVALERLQRRGIEHSALIAAETVLDESHRTRSAAASAVEVMARRKISGSGVNVFTRSVHARRSHLIFRRAFGGRLQVGVVSWIPHGSTEMPWWRQTQRAKDLLEESVGFFVEGTFGLIR